MTDQDTAQEIADEIKHFKNKKYDDYQGLVIQIEEILEEAGYTVD